MGLFGNAPDEEKRRQGLKEMEDGRLRMAQRLQKEGFAPEKMLALSTGRGGLAAFCRDGGEICLIVSPDFGERGEFVLERYARLKIRKEAYSEPSEGMAGVFGFGKKGTTGYELIVERRDGEWSMPVLTARSSGAVWGGKKNPLLGTRRRRKDANIVWELMPLDKAALEKYTKMLDEIVGDE